MLIGPHDKDVNLDDYFLCTMLVMLKMMIQFIIIFIIIIIINVEGCDDMTMQI